MIHQTTPVVYGPTNEVMGLTLTKCLCPEGAPDWKKKKLENTALETQMTNNLREYENSLTQP